MAINLQKGQKVNLTKSASSGLGKILVNLNWNSKAEKKGLMALFASNSAIDLDLGCLFELKDGRKGAVQALGNAFGNLEQAPYIMLDGDDRTGSAVGGENLRINGDMIGQIQRVLVYTFIYEGVANWQQADGTVTIQYPGAEDLVIHMDTYNSKQRMCALAMFTNVNDETFSVEKLIEFYPSHKEMDEAHKWGMQWRAGRK